MVSRDCLLEGTVSSRQDLVRKFQELQDRIRSLMEDPVMAAPDQTFENQWSPPADAYETEDEFVLTIEVPGIEQEQIDLQIKDLVLSLKGQRNPCADLANQVYYRLERPSGTFERRFSVPDSIDTEKIRAKLHDGVLTVSLPKKQRRKKFKVEVRKSSGQDA